MNILLKKQKQVTDKLWLILVIIIGYITPMKAANPEWIYIPNEYGAWSFFEKGEYMYFNNYFAYKMHKESLKIVDSIRIACQRNYFIDNNDIAWLIDYNRVVKISGNDTIRYTSDNSIIINSISDAKYDKTTNTIWLATSGGLIRIKNYEWTLFNKTNSGIQTDTLVSLFIEENSNLIIGTKRQGLILFDGSTFVNHRTDSLDQSIYMISSVQKDEKGNIWFIYRYNLAKFDGKSWSLYRQSDSTFNTVIGELFVENSKNIWIAGYTIFHFDGERFNEFKLFDGERKFESTHSIYKDKKGNMWFGVIENNNQLGIVIHRKGGVILSAELENTLKQIGYIFPNPSDDYIQLKAEIELGTNFLIINTNGIEVDSGIYNGHIDISKLNPGFYTININNQNFKFIKK